MTKQKDGIDEGVFFSFPFLSSVAFAKATIYAACGIW